MADFSLHLEPRDLDTLVRVVSDATGIIVNGLREHLLFDHTAIDEEDKGAMLVSTQITHLFASVKEQDAEQIARKWYETMGALYPSEQIVYSNDATEAIRKMIMVCQQAQLSGDDLVHIWYA